MADAKSVKALRKRTGAPMMDCKAALDEAGGDLDKAVDVLRKKGLKTADNKADREATEGKVFTYVHHNGKLGVMVELACETDFVALNEEFDQFGKDLCLHIAAMNPVALTRDDIDAAVVEKERSVLTEQARETMKGRPEAVIEKATEGRLKKFFEERCLVDQPFVRSDEGQSVEESRKALIGKIGENIQIRRFVRMELGA